MATRRSAKKTPKKAVAKKTVKKTAKKPSKKSQATPDEEMMARLNEAERLLKRMRDAGIPASPLSYVGETAYQSVPQPMSDPKILITNGEMHVIHGHQDTSIPTPSTSYTAELAYFGPQRAAAVANIYQGTVADTSYGSPPSEGVATVQVKPGGHVLVRTGEEARRHAEHVLNQFNLR